MTTTHPKRIREGYEPIPGYTLEAVIGRGGFGEVWRASAPGGLKKAVKFVFGAQDESRASRELRSLERIKGVQHPFLLTLERFEAIEDQLVIVTELADCSLEDVFKRNRDRGSCGIPRDVLISHLHDAADALDYLHQRYQLQHLDIKPGNLLLVGGHVKVADFGLLKDLRETECSIVGGLTPIYAPPEIFDGKPSMHSDQYSLAVMYQELLTGARPFSGRTIAQLATQHVHSAPNLEPLPPGDRPVIARALEKNPQRRFAKCIDFVDALRDSLGRSTKVTLRGDDLGTADTKVGAAGKTDAESIKDLPQIRTGAPIVASCSRRCAIVIALGGTGAECLRLLRNRVAGLLSASPLDLHGVLVDTDMATIHSMRVGEVSDRVPPCKTVYTPLRSAHEYRQEPAERWQTISRRWIYNVPRSGATEGMRPLGRLALVDHGKMVAKKLAEALEDVAVAAGQESPSVYVVGSLTGGTGSGMYIDVVHLLRHLLDEAGAVETPILSMLSIAPINGFPNHPLALHDAQAAITEIRHFLRVGNGYPGDAGAGWPSVPAARTPLRDVYLIAEPPRGSLTPPAVQTIADYIWSDATNAGDLLKEARKFLMPENNIIPPSIRSVGVVPLGYSAHIERKVLAPAVVKELLIRWLGLPSEARRAAVPLAVRVTRRIGLDADVVIQEAGALLNADHREEIEQAQSPDAIAKMIDSFLGEDEPLLLVGDMFGHLRRELSIRLNDRRADVTTVIECLKRIQDKAETLISELRRVTTDTEDEEAEAEAEAEEEMDTEAEPSPTSHSSLAERYIAAHHLEQLHARIKSLQDYFDQLATALAMSIVKANQSQPGEEDPWEELPPEIQSGYQEVLSQLHGSAVSQILIRTMGDSADFIDPSAIVDQLTEDAVPLITSLLNEHSQLLSCGNTSVESTSAVASTADYYGEGHAQTAVTAEMQPMMSRNPDQPLSAEDALFAVKPALLTFGGLQRLLLVVGSDAEQSQWESRIRAAHDGSLTVAVIPGATVKLIHEAQQIEIDNLLSRLTVVNGGNAQVAGRLSSRTDINW